MTVFRCSGVRVFRCSGVRVFGCSGVREIDVGSGADREHTPIEDMELFRRYVAVADWAWGQVTRWPSLARDTVGKQLVRALDSVGANLVEGDGRFSGPDSIHFFVIARASARESRYWLQRAIVRNLIDEAVGSDKTGELASATQLLNRLIAYRRKASTSLLVREHTEPYECARADPWQADVLNT
jgi:four helix bundle protein